MRFTKRQRYPFNDTSRKRALVLVRQRKDREKFPLFATEIGEGQKSVDDVMIARADAWARSQVETRQRHAVNWREARRQLAAFPEPERSALRAYWNHHRWLPGDPVYLLGELHSFRVGRLVLHEGRIESAHHLKWIADRDAKIAAMTDAELDHMIQTHISLQFVELGRAERQRRVEASMAVEP